MVHSKGITVTVQVHGRDLTEYTDEESDETNHSIINRYIPSSAGEAFSLWINSDELAYKDCTGYDCVYTVDGVMIDGTCIKVDRYPDIRIEGPSGYVDGVYTTHRVYFAELKTNENPVSDGELKKKLDSVGLITLQMFRARNFRTLPTNWSETMNYRGELAEVDVVPEKALKGQALDTAARVGEAEQTGKTPGTLTFDYIDGLLTPYLTFNFKYRSRKALQTMGIIPRSPSPLPLEERPRESLSREELLELLARQAQRPTKSQVDEKIKREGQPKRVRDEETDEILASARSGKRQRNTEVEVIDLLDD